MGNAWGRDMYRVLHQSQITLNHHIGVAGPYANNMRLYEATGVGTLLMTDWKQNLKEIFDPGKEIVTYRTPEECAELLTYYLEHSGQREAIARAGQERTLRDHNYCQRMGEFIEIVREYL
jgi:spore maturation protein CgeB